MPKLNWKEGDTFPPRQPSVTGIMFTACPGQVEADGPVVYRIHGPGNSFGCITQHSTGEEMALEILEITPSCFKYISRDGGIVVEEKIAEADKEIFDRTNAQSFQ